MISKTMAVLFAFAIALVTSPANGQSPERPCELEDLPGTWEIFVVRKLQQQVPVDYQDLLQPYQLISYSVDLSFRRITFSKQIERADAITLLSRSPREKFRIDGGIVTTMNEAGAILERYECQYFVQDNPRANIPKGTLSLMWRRQGAPLILHGYRKPE